jgi:hypothetical protein
MVAVLIGYGPFEKICRVRSKIEGYHGGEMSYWNGV